MGNKYVRELYFSKKGFLSPNYDPEEVYVQTTYKRRTIDSANAQLAGIFDREMTYPYVDPLYEFETIPEDQNFDTHLSHDNCARF